MSLLDVFRVKIENVNVSLSPSEARKKLEAETLFDESQPRGWRYRNEGKRFIGFMNEDTFYLIQKPMQGTRFGAVVQGTLAVENNEPVLQLKSWVDQRATRKLIFGCFLTVFVVARVIRERFFADAVPAQDSILPYILLAVVPMTAFAAHLYEKNRNEAMRFVKNIFTV